MKKSFVFGWFERVKLGLGKRFLCYFWWYLMFLMVRKVRFRVVVFCSRCGC